MRRAIVGAVMKETKGPPTGGVGQPPDQGEAWGLGSGYNALLHVVTKVLKSSHGLERRHRRWDLEGIGGGAEWTAIEAKKIGGAWSCQREPLHALHAVPCLLGEGEKPDPPRVGPL